MFFKRYIQRKALNELAFLGSAYNSITDNYSLFLVVKNHLRRYISFKETNKTNYTCFTDEVADDDILSKLGYQSELIDSSLVDLVRLDDFAKSIITRKNRNGFMRFYLHVIFEKGEESIAIPDQLTENQINLDNDLIEEFNSTHFVTGIKWGVEVLVTFEYKLEEENRNLNELKKLFEQLIDALFKDKLIQDINLADFRDRLMYTIQSNTYFDTQQFRKVEDLKKLIENLALVAAKINEGKGVPLEYKLTPIKKNNLAESEIETKRIREVMKLAKESRAEIETICKDRLYKNRFDLVKMIEENDTLYDAMNDMEIEEIKTKEELSQLLTEARMGNKSNEEIMWTCDSKESKIIETRDNLKRKLKMNITNHFKYLHSNNFPSIQFICKDKTISLLYCFLKYIL